MTAPTDSRQGPGTLTLGSSDYGAQISNVNLTPSQNSTDGTPTLGNPKPAPMVETSWELSGTAIQDWENTDGFVEYCRTNNNTEVPFVWTPNTNKAVTYSGTCQIRAVEIGGDVATQNTSDFTFPVVGELTRGTTPPSNSPSRK